MCELATIVDERRLKTIKWMETIVQLRQRRILRLSPVTYVTMWVPDGYSEAAFKHSLQLDVVWDKESILLIAYKSGFYFPSLLVVSLSDPPGPNRSNLIL